MTNPSNPTFAEEIEMWLEARTPAGIPLAELINPPAPVERPQIGTVGFVILGHVGPVRATVLSRFWTIPAHKNPIARRMAAL